jgi:hypothetical protein
MRLFRLADILRVKMMERRQYQMLRDLERINRERSSYSTSRTFYDRDWRATVRATCARVTGYDKTVENYYDALNGMDVSVEGGDGAIERIQNMKSLNRRLADLIDIIERGELVLMDRLLDTEEQEAKDIAETLYIDGPAAVGVKIDALKRQLALDTRVLDEFGDVSTSAHREKLGRCGALANTLYGDWRTMQEHLDRINRYRREAITLRAKAQSLSGMSEVLMGEERRIYSESGDLTFVGRENRSKVVNVLKALQSKWITYLSEVDNTNRMIKRLEYAIPELERWYRGLGSRPKEIEKAYKEAESAFRMVSEMRTIEKNSRGLSSVAQLIERIEAIG